MKLEWYLARRYLASRRGTQFLSLFTLISVGGVFVGVMALVLVTAVMTGLQREIREQILGTHSHVWVLVQGGTMRMESHEEPLRRIRQIPQVVAAAPFVHAEVGLVNAAGHSEAAALRGIDPEAAGPPVIEIVREIREGRLPLAPASSASGYPPLLVGEGLARRFGLYSGSVVQLISIRAMQIGPLGQPVPRRRYFEVVGEFRTGVHQYDETLMYTTLAAAQELIGFETAVTGLEVRVPEADRAHAVGRRIEEALGPDYFTQDWRTMNASLFDALKLEKLAIGIILFLIVVVAAFNIISTLVMLVTDKTREIGILKSMGLRSAQVQRVFILQGLVIGAGGASLGTAGGLLLAWAQNRYGLIAVPAEIYFVDRLPMVVDTGEVALILGLSILISFLATLYPARQAARLLPIEAIRHE